MADVVANLERQRWIDRVLGTPLCWLLTLGHRLAGRDAAPREVRRILIVLLSEMGAIVLTQPMFDRLRQRYPSAEIYVLCSEQNRPALDLIDAVPAERVITIRTGSLATLAPDAMRAVRQMRALQLDAVLDLELFARVSAIFAGLCGAAIRVGFHRHTQEGLYRGDFINRRVLYNPYQHVAQQFVTLAEAIGAATDVPTGKRLVSPTPFRSTPLPLRPGEVDEMRDALYGRHPSIANRPLVFLNPGAGILPIRAWPLESFGTVARALIDRGYAVAVVGLQEDRELARAIQRTCDSPMCVDLTGFTATVRDVVRLLHLGVLLIANDGGTAHFASLTPIASIVLFGPETPSLYGSLSPRAVNLHKPLSCSPCLTAYNHRRSPCDGDNVCLKSIAPEEVLALAAPVIASAAPAR